MNKKFIFNPIIPVFSVHTRSEFFLVNIELYNILSIKNLIVKAEYLR